MKLNSPAIQPAWYITADGRLDMDKLLKGFQQFFREHSESWVERFDYKEAGPQLLMQAFLQRIINGGEQRVVIALKLLQKPSKRGWRKRGNTWIAAGRRRDIW